MIVFLQLSISTGGGTVYHLIKQFNKEKDGYAGWLVLCKWFDGGVMQAEIADSVRGRLMGEGLSENYALSVFLSGIKDTHYETFVAIQKNEKEGLQDAIITLRKHERVILASRKARRVLRNRARKIIDNYEEEDKEEEKCPTKIRRVRADATMTMSIKFRWSREDTYVSQIICG
eukprot:4454403-Ditylum_brightwellii.AAC.1